MPVHRRAEDERRRGRKEGEERGEVTQTCPSEAPGSGQGHFSQGQREAVRGQTSCGCLQAYLSKRHSAMAESQAPCSVGQLWWFHLLTRVVGAKEVPQERSRVSGAGLSCCSNE